MARVAHPYLLGNTFHPSVLVTRFLPQAQKSQRADSRKVSKAQYSVSSGKPFVQYLHNPAKPQQQAEVTRHRVKGTTPEDVFRFPDDDEERPNNRRGTDDRQKQSSGILSYQTNCKCIRVKGPHNVGDFSGRSGRSPGSLLTYLGLYICSNAPKEGFPGIRQVFLKQQVHFFLS